MSQTYKAKGKTMKQAMREEREAALTRPAVPVRSFPTFEERFADFTPEQQRGYHAARARRDARALEAQAAREKAEKAEKKAEKKAEAKDAEKAEKKAETKDAAEKAKGPGDGK